MLALLLSIQLALASAPADRDIGPGVLPCEFAVTLIEGPTHPLFGKPSVTATDINDAGLVVGYFGWLTDQPFKWSPELGFVPLPPPFGAAYARAMKVNNNGWIVVEAETNSGGPRGFVVTPEGAWIEMEPPGGSGHSGARGINDDNTVVGWVRVIPADGGPWEEVNCIVWRPDFGMEIVKVEPGPSCGCEAINASGTIVGWVGEGQHTAGTQGFVLDPDGTTTLMGPIPGGVSSAPKAISDDGVIVGWGRYTVQPASVRGFVYAHGRMLHRADPDRPFVNTHLYDFVPGGAITGRQFKVGGPDEPAMWRSTGEWVLLDSMIDADQGFDLYAAERAAQSGAIVAKGSKLIGPTYFNFAMVLSPIVNPPDFDCDGSVGASELLQLIDHWGVEGGYFDLNGDLVVDGADLGMLLGAWSD